MVPRSYSAASRSENLAVYAVERRKYVRFLEEKDQNIHLNYKFSPFKIANTSLQKQNFPGMRLPNSTFFHSLIEDDSLEVVSFV